VIIAIIEAAQAMEAFETKVAEEDMNCEACILRTRNNEMIPLIAKYFL
jgi:hypothetical protein